MENNKISKESIIDREQLGSLHQQQPENQPRARDQEATGINRGRWTPIEKYAFFKYYLKYRKGDKYKKIAKKVGTRDYQQVRSHAQKTFGKMLKTIKSQLVQSQAQKEIQEKGSQMVTRHSTGRRSKLSRQPLSQRSDADCQEELQKKIRQEMAKILPFINQEELGEDSEEECSEELEMKQKIMDEEEKIKMEPQEEIGVKKEEEDLILPIRPVSNKKLAEIPSYFMQALIPMLPICADLNHLIDYPAVLPSKPQRPEQRGFVRTGTNQSDGLYRRGDNNWVDPSKPSRMPVVTVSPKAEPAVVKKESNKKPSFK